VVVDGQKTSISIEDAFWSELKSLARRQDRTVSDLVQSISTSRAEGANLSSAVRVYVLDQLRPRQATRNRDGE
jgi:predicted DNA-binding ribbon-helix-helix protein